MGRFGRTGEVIRSTAQIAAARVLYEQSPAARSARLAIPILAMAVFLAPYTTWRLVPDYLFTWSDALFCFAALLMLPGRGINARPFGDLSPLWFIGLVLMLFAFLVSSLLHADPGRWLVVAAQYGFAFGLLPMLLISRELGWSAIGPAKALIAGVVAMEAFGASIYYLTDGSYEAASAISHDFITGAHRLGAFMADANWNAAMIATTMPFLLYARRTGALGAVPTYVALTALVAGLLLSGSVTGFASTVVALVIFLLVSGGSGATRLAIGLALVAGVAIFVDVPLPEAFRERVQTALTQGDINQAGTFVGRWELIKEAWGMVGSTIFTGLGVDQYRVASEHGAPVHNMFLIAWAEGGLGALLGWLLLMIVPIVASLRALRSDRVTAALGLAVIAPFLIFSMAAPHMYARSWIVPLLVAMAIVLRREELTRRAHPRLSNYPLRVRPTSKASPAAH